MPIPIPAVHHEDERPVMMHESAHRSSWAGQVLALDLR